MRGHLPFKSHSLGPIFPPSKRLWQNESKTCLFQWHRWTIVREIKNKLNICTHPLPPAWIRWKPLLDYTFALSSGKKDFLSKPKAFVPSGSVSPSLSATVKQGRSGASLVVQWLRFSASSAGGMGSIPGQGTKILYPIVQPKKKKSRTNLLGHVRPNTGLPTGACRAVATDSLIHFKWHHKGPLLTQVLRCIHQLTLVNLKVMIAPLPPPQHTHIHVKCKRKVNSWEDNMVSTSQNGV